MDKVFSANAPLKPVLGGAMSAFGDAARKASDAVHEQALSSALVVNGNRVAEQANAAAQSASRFAESARQALDGLLLARIERLSVERDIYVGIAIAVMAIVVVLFSAMYRSIVAQVRTALQVAEAVAGGDLTQQFDVTRHDELGRLMEALKRMNASLLEIVRNISGSVGVINSAAQEIASGNTNLSQRTEEQAASLEETAASMEELTSTVKQNAENAQQASTLTASASDIALKGSTAVGHVVGTMTEISASSSKIAEITGIIEGIAFQTNILALNAAVEAARAGEQGRGFAVVASEVRSLAQRSSSAAKEIKELIVASVQKIRDGSELADQAGKTMSEVTRAVDRVNDIMGEIAAATSEQSRGIEQVHQAISQMDKVTQQNAALVEEASAASQSLEMRGRQLNQTVAFFRLDGTFTQPVAQSAQRP
ncbi:HAMP domain-containing protein [Paraburkholderia sp. LEh10]|nr:HAMP domain-containing protein [Paraburkholderia sp. LEh10]